jgi:hypothetical protein
MHRRRLHRRLRLCLCRCFAAAAASVAASAASAAAVFPQDGIDFNVLPQCFQPGEDWTIQVSTHLETAMTADLHCNLQIGSGGDVYLGAFYTHTHSHVPVYLAPTRVRCAGAAVGAHALPTKSVVKGCTSPAL